MLRTGQRKNLPARSEFLIQGISEVSGQFRYAVTDFPIQFSQKDVLVAATLVDLKRETIPVRVLNPDNIPKTVDKGAVIATSEPVVDIVARPQEFSEARHLSSILENLEGRNEEQRTAVRELLREFQNLFSSSDSDVGCCNMTQHRINTECEKSFNSLKQALTTSPVLAYLRTDKEFILDTDARNEGIGAVLSQKIRNEERVIAYFSKSLEHFHHYLYGRKFLLRTHHASLRWFLNSREPEGQIACWIQRLQGYDFEIQLRKGTSHGNADILSRRPCKENCKHCTNAEKKFGMETDMPVKVLTTTKDPWSFSEIQKAQLEDPAIGPILEKKLNSED
ncbi:hypothetical protein AVEN_184448-2 [Araneus ventricosus]|uniref:Reverse transcriptase/retrotransposon-derived protein RNase H-like domain-containing protein n=1 Tax=Araneus ventricosus TaxID=182803 RepID=A0A4Y2BGI0_ARAVE|nr:hypothetical protein AVEN_184448-2 [Araneus ventricosus]